MARFKRCITCRRCGISACISRYQEADMSVRIVATKEERLTRSGNSKASQLVNQI